MDIQACADVGMHATAGEIHVSTLYQIWRFRNTLKPGETFQGYDAVYVPRDVSPGSNAPADVPKIEVTTSRMFNAWLGGQRASLVLTTYQTGKIFFIGVQPNGRLSVFERTLERAMGMHATAGEIHVSTLYQIWRFRNTLKPGETFQGYDAVYVPRESRVTGDVDVHDIVIDADGRVIFTNTLFNCLATIDDDHNFRPLWRPPWISKLVLTWGCTRPLGRSTSARSIRSGDSATR